MVSIRIKYLSDKIEKLRYIDGKSDWIDLRAAESGTEGRRIPPDPSGHCHGTA